MYLAISVCFVSGFSLRSIKLIQLKAVQIAILAFKDFSTSYYFFSTLIKDFKFKNSTDSPIYIEGYTTDGKQVVFNIYGEETRPSNRTVKYTNKVLESTPAGTKLFADAEQGIGYRLVESGHNGCKAELYKEDFWQVIDDNCLQNHVI